MEMIGIKKTLFEILDEHKAGTLDMSLYPNNQAISCYTDKEYTHPIFFGSMRMLLQEAESWNKFEKDYTNYLMWGKTS